MVLRNIIALHQKCDCAETPLLSRGGEGRRARSASPIGRSLNKSGGWGGAGQKIDLLTNTTPAAPVKGSFAAFFRWRSHTPSAEEVSRRLQFTTLNFLTLLPWSSGIYT